MFKARLARRVFKGVVILAILGVLGVGSLLGALWLEHSTEVTLPAPTGPFAVGRTLYDWLDNNTLDALAPVPGTKRELLVWIWYPGARQSGAVADDPEPVALRAPARPIGGPLLLRPLTWLFKLLTRDPSKVHGHSIRNAVVSPQQPSYSVVIMRGGASAGVIGYSTLAEDLASHGYVVVGFDAPYRTGEVVFPDGRVIERRPENNPELFAGEELIRLAEKLVQAWSGDIGFALNQLERLNASDPSGRFVGRLNMQRVGVFGHSLGGAEALQFCHDDSRCKACLDLDGAPWGSVVREGVTQPVMFLMSDHKGESDPEGAQIEANFRSLLDRLPMDRRLEIMIAGANHYMFSDDGVLKSHIVLWTLRRLGILGIDGDRQLAVTAYGVHSFFDAYLKGLGVSRPKISSPLYPEIQVLK
jgi:dienelactone hydrolase